MKIEDFKFFKTRGLIDGNWVSALNHETFQVINPGTEELIAEVPEMGTKDALKAVSAAEMAFKTWKKSSFQERTNIFENFTKLVVENQKELATLLTVEQGKIYSHALSEVLSLVDRVKGDIYAAKFAQGKTHDISDKAQYFNLRQPIGVVAGISPWNYPLSTTIKKISAPIAAGCTVVIKPSETTPLVNLAMAAMWKEAGLPNGVLNMITANNPKEIGEVLVTDPRVKAFAFTGSTQAGVYLASKAMNTAKQVILEMGGNSPFVVYEDADLEVATDSLLGFKITNAGQICVCPNRIIVHQNIKQKFVDLLTMKFKKQKLGYGMDKSSTYGPLNSAKHLEKIESVVKDAVNEGGIVCLGGKKIENTKGFYFPLTILTGLRKNMNFSKIEIFGPIVAIYSFVEDQEAIDFSNDTNYGLASYVFTQSPRRAWEFIHQIEAGGVGVNQGGFVGELGIFGGYKESGVGRIGQVESVENYLEYKNVGWRIDTPK